MIPINTDDSWGIYINNWPHCLLGWLAFGTTLGDVSDPVEVTPVTVISAQDFDILANNTPPDPPTVDEILRAPSLAPEDNASFLKDCGKRLACLKLADPETGRIYAELNNGKLRWADQDALQRQCENADARAGIEAMIPDLADTKMCGEERGSLLDQNSSHTLGQWSNAG